MSRFGALFASVLIVGCSGGNGEPQSVDPVDPRPSGADPVDYAFMVEGRVTDADGAQARFAGAGTMAATVAVRAVALDGVELARGEVEQGQYRLGFEERPGDTLLFVEALAADDGVLGRVVVEVTDAELLQATPLDVETSVEAAVLEALLASQAELGIWAEVRDRIDTPVALAVASDADPQLAVQNAAVAVEAAWQAQLDAWIRHGIAVDAVSAARWDAAVALSAALAAGDPQAYERFEIAVREAALAQGLGEDAAQEADTIAHAAMRAALLATSGAEQLVLEAIRRSALDEARSTQSIVASQVLAMQADGSSTADLIDAACADLEAALQNATTIDEIQAAIDTWRQTVLGALEAEIDSQLDFFDQLVQSLTEMLLNLELVLQDLDAALQGLIDATADALANLDFENLDSLDLEAFTQDIATAYDAFCDAIEQQFADLDPEDAQVMTSVSVAFPAL